MSANNSKAPNRGVVLAVVAALIGAAIALIAPPTVNAAPCDGPVVNEIACENSLPGSPESEWGVAGAGSAAIQGFATDISVDQGGTVEFKIDTTASAYRLDIYRMGYYGGDGARLVDTVDPSAVTDQPSCLTDPSTGLVDCGNWSVSATWAVPGDAVSGIYFAKLVRTDGTPGSSHVVFIVRDDDGNSDLLFQTADTTWQAYNAYGGNSLYSGSPDGRAYKVSYNRPFTTRGDAIEDWVFNSEYPMVRFLERNGYDVSYTTGIDTDRRGAELLEHQAFLSVGHDEYWSGAQRANVEAARDAGVNLAFFSGNEMFWKTRWETSIDGSGTPYRTLVSYKETKANAIIDPATPIWTGTWRDNRFSPPTDGGRPENALTGQLFRVNCCEIDMELDADAGALRFWRNTRVAALSGTQTTTIGSGIIGYEWDEDADNGSRPAGLFRVSETQASGLDILLDNGSTYGQGSATHSMTMYRAASGALVFGAGTVQWSWGLDDEHDRGPASTSDVAAQQATVNLLADMGAQPATLQSGLVAASASTDITAPTSIVTQPANGSTVPPASTVVVSGTSSDVGGNVGGVEVSIDDGITWRRATGRSSWSYSFTSPVSGSVSIKVRATDDSGNIETPGAATTVDVGGSVACPCSIWPSTAVPDRVDGDVNSVEVGVKFQSSVDGYITGVRFFKHTVNTGTHTGHLWSSDGTLLGTATFRNESASGWQEATFAAPIAVSAGATYVASYFAPNGRYAVSDFYFASSGVTNGPLTALQDGVDGGNGVYRYGSTPGQFPTNTWETENYWVDVVFATTAEDSTPPSLEQRTPTVGATKVPVNSAVTITFTEPVDEGTIQFALTNASAGPVTGSSIYDAPTRTLTFTPGAPLANESVYAVAVSGAIDGAGNVMVPATWSFTTAPPPPPLPTEGPGGPIGVVTSGSDPFSGYFAEILRGEGLNAFESFDVAGLDATKLSGFTTIVLGRVPLTASQVTDLTTWVTAGGNLIASRPDTKLAPLLGLAPATGTLSQGYLKVDPATEAGAGIVSETMQFRGTADRYTLTGASAIATLFSSSSTSTPNPAVTLRSVGSNGGQVAAFTYDLARSVVYQRQGNPAWAGQERDFVDGNIRSNDLFFGGAETDWVDLSKVAIPQADEQQRLFANLVEVMNRDEMPLPRFWYFPGDHQAVVVATGDDHGNNGTAQRFDTYLAADPPGCSVDDWECPRFTSYLYPSTPLSNSAALAYEAAGFEVGLHASNGCTNFVSEADLRDAYASEIDAWATAQPGLTPVTARFHCIIWSDWGSQFEVEAENGIRLDTNYYYYPGSWVNDRPGFMTGSGMPQRFARQDGTMVDVYQAATQMTDESGQRYPYTADTLLDRALGAEGYYGYFVANMHTDVGVIPEDTALLASAMQRGVPVVTSRQVLEFVDGRNQSSFRNLTWTANALRFDVAVGSGARNLTAMVPVVGPDGLALASLQRGTTAVAFQTKTIKGIDYAVFPAVVGAYTATYDTPGVDVVAPVVSGRSPGVGALDVGVDSLVSVAFSEPVVGSSVVMSVSAAGGGVVAGSVSYDVGSRTATFTPSGPLANSTVFSVAVSGAADAAGNVMVPVSWNFTTVAGVDCPCSVFAPSDVPVVASSGDPGSVELGMKFQSDVAGFVTGVRFFKGAGNTGTHTGNLWSADGTRLASVTFTGESASGWQEALFSSPVAIEANTTYVVSYHAPNGNYSANVNGLATAVTDRPLRALASGSSGGNGVYVYGAGGFPTNTYNATNYWVDVVFDTAVGPDVVAPVVSGRSPGVGAVDVAATSPVSVAFSEPVVGSSVVMSVSAAGGGVVAGSVSYDVGSRTATFTPSGPLANSTVFSVAVSGAADAAGNVMVPVSWNFTTAAPIVCPCSIWSPTDVPDRADSDTSSVEVGVKFRAAEDGVISALRFFKYAENTGTHTGHLWTATGTLLGTVAFTNETGAGWQEASFSTPVPVTAGTTYVASYFAPNGRYGVSSNYFATSGVTRGPLTALASGVQGGNGVYRYTSTPGAFPSATYQSENYWVDVVFGAPGADVVAPVVSGRSPGAGAVDVAATSPVSVTFSEPVVGSSVVMSVSAAGGGVVAGSVSYDVGSRTATFTPSGPLANSTVFSVAVSGAADAAGNVMVPVSWNFTTVAPADVVAPVVSGRSPGVGALDVGVDSLVSVAFSEPVVGSSVVMSVSAAGGGVVAGSVSYDVGSRTATFTPSGPLANSTVFSVAVSGAADAAGNVMVPVSWSFTTVAAVSCPCSVFSSSDVPANPSSGDTGSVELGMKFQSDVAGFVTGVRYYKGAGNTGTHTGNLWSADGTRLASVTFTGESASGWQEALFSSPVAIEAGTTYVVSYHAPNGGYAYEVAGFASEVANGPLRALSSGSSGGNGVYVYGAGGFPTGSWNATNYFVDAVFTTVAPADVVAPVVSGRSPGVGALDVGVDSLVSVAFSEPVVGSSVVMSVSAAGGGVVAGSVSYDVGSRTATFTPSGPLANSTVFSVAVSGAADAAGNVMVPVSWSFTTVAAVSCPCSVFSSSDVPANPSSGDTGSVELGMKFQSDVAGFVTGVRFFKGAGNTGTHTGNLWSADGTRLASVTFTGESASGWQEALFSSPVAIEANTTYVVSYHAPNGGYAYEVAGFASEIANGPMRALASGSSGGNGVYVYGAGGFPTGSWNATNYFVDAVFDTN